MQEFSGVEYEKEKNISFASSVRVDKSLGERFYTGWVFLNAFLYLFRVKICPVSIKYLVYFSRVYLRVYFAFRRAPLKPTVLVVANDHTDFPVAAAMVMNVFRRSVVYVQHAEVTNNFPPLDFDISLLRNEVSLGVYRNIGRVRGEVYIVPRELKASRAISNLSGAECAYVNVVIYVSSIFSSNGLTTCIEALKLNSNVSSITIKAHPRSDLDALSNYGVEVTSTVPEFDHVAIVANSSVVIELLDAGIKVYQCFSLDDIPKDYYGFVDQGISCEVFIAELPNIFWKNVFFDQLWFERFAKYSPNVNDDWKKELPLLKVSIARILSE